MKMPYVSMDDVDGFEEMSEHRKYDAMIMKIAAEAPLRFCEGETVCGAATLGGAIFHTVPALYRGKNVFGSVSHLTPGFDRAVREGLDSYARRIAERFENGGLDARQTEVLASMKHSLEALRVWHGRYLDAAREARPDLYALLCQVPFGPAHSFYEAVQSLWFLFAFLRLCGNWPGIGRIDALLGPYLEQDLKNGVLTRDKAREILAGFFIKGCEWIRSDAEPGSGDAQHYQNIVLGGVDETGRDITNDVSHLVLEIVEELGISDFPIAVRASGQTPRSLLDKTADVTAHGGGVAAVYNEPLILRSLEKFGYTPAQARRFANDGCWEVQIPGETCFRYIPFDALQILQKQTLQLEGKPAHFDSFEELYAAFREDLKYAVERICKDAMAHAFAGDPAEGQYNEAGPCSVISLFEDDCIGRARPYFEGGPVYTVVSPHIGGLPDVANSLLAIKKLVFEEKKIFFDELMRTLAGNWEGAEPLRQYVQNRYIYYGNDGDEADGLAARILGDFSDFTQAMNGRSPILFPAGVSTFGRQIEWSRARTASPHGYRRGDILSGNLSPTPGTDTAGATALIRSYCRPDLERTASGAALDVKLFPTAVTGARGRGAIVGLIDGFLALGGFFMQIDVVSGEDLLQAREHPEQYKTLAVRISGWSARFVTLDRHWQDMVIERTARRI